MLEWARELKPEMIDNTLCREIADSIGVENLLKLSVIVGGTTSYIPKERDILRPVRDAHIKAEFNGYNHIELAKRYDVTERWVRALCGQGEIMGQIDIFQYEDT